MTSMSNGAAIAASHIVVGDFDARSMRSQVEYRVLVPADTSGGERLPLILHLHGAMSSSASLETAKLAYDAAWGRYELPRAVVTCASTPTLGGFYIDHPNGPAWETLLVDEGPGVLRQRFDLDEVRAVIGLFPMGGYGALNSRFASPSATPPSPRSAPSSSRVRHRHRSRNATAPPSWESCTMRRLDGTTTSRG